MLKKNKGDDNNRAYWTYVERTAEEVRKWPSWKLGNASGGSAPSTVAGPAQATEASPRTDKKSTED